MIESRSYTGILSLAGAVLLAGLLCYLCLTPPGSIAAVLPAGFPLRSFLCFNDLYHLLGYCALSLMILGGLGQRYRWRFVAALLLPLVLGGAIEVLQQGIPEHQPSLKDFGLDVLGSVIAVGCCRRQTP